MRTLSTIERAQIRKQFVMTLCNLSAIDVYWSARARRIFTHGVASHRLRVMPPDAGLIGTYAHPFSCSDFMSDLDDAIAKAEFDATHRSAAV